MRYGSRCGGRLYAMNSILTHGLRQHHVDRVGGWFATYFSAGFGTTVR